MITGRSRYKPNMAFKKTRRAADAPASHRTMTESADTPASSLGDVLVEQDVLTPEQLWQAYDAHVASEQPLATILMERGWADEAQITQAYARLHAVPYAPLDEAQTPPQPEALALIPQEVAQGYQALPLSVQPDPSGDGPPSLELAMVNPWDEEFLALVRQQTGCEPRPRIAGPQSLLQAVARAYAPAASEPEVIPADESSDETPADEMPADETPAALEPAAESVSDAQAQDEDDEETLLPAPPPRFTFADADAAPSPVTPRLGDILAAQGALSPDQLAQATQAHADTGISFVEVLLIEGMADEEQIARAQAVEFGLPYASLSNWRPTSEALAAVPPALALEYQFLPLSLQRGGGGLRIAAARPWDETTRHALQERLGCALEPFLASESALQSALARAYPPVVEASAPETESAPPEAEASVPDEAVLNEAAPVTADAGEPSSAEIAVIQETGQAGEMTAADGEAATEPQTALEGEAALESGLIAEAEVLPEAEVPLEAEADEVDEPIASVESMTEAAPEREAETDEAPPEGTVHFVNMGLTAEPPSLGGILIATNVLTAEQVQQAVYEADTSGQTVSAVIRAHGWADEEQIARAQAAQANVEFVALSDQTPPADVLALVPYEIASYYQALPLSRGDSDGDAPFALRVAMANPGDAEVIGLMERHIGCRVVPLQAAETSLLTLVERVYNAPPPVAEHEPEPAPVEAIAEQEESPIAEQEAETPLTEAAPESLTAAPETEVEDAVPEMAAALETPEDLAPIVEAQTEADKDILAAPAPEAVLTEPETADEAPDEIPAAVEAVAEPDAPPATEPAEVVLAESSADELVALASDTPDLTPALVPEDENTALAEALLSDQTARLGDILVALKVITSDQLAQALDEQIQTQQRLGAVLMAHGWADEEQITRARSVQFDVSYLAVANLESDPFAIQLLPYEIARQYLVLPISIQEHENEPEGRLLVAMANPWDVEVIDLVQRYARRRVEPFLASERGLRAALERAYLDDQADVHNLAMTDSIEQAGLREMELEEMTDDVDLSETLHQSDQAPVIRFVNTLFSDAVNRRASDIHIEPRKRDFQIRYRIDGQLQTVRAVPRQFLAATTSRIKIMAEMDIVERRLPLDGRIALRVDNRSIDLRVSTMPTQYGERVVMRVLDRSSVRIGLEQLGFSDHNEKAFRSLIRQPHGIILVTGPTGSGKTTTLYAALNALKSSETNILTVEDPIEYEMEGVSQSNVNEKAGLTFARQLRAILRQDPDVVLVGEIRDAETAEIAFRAALTGHLVLSTLHCNEAAGAVSRLLDMGVPPFLIASTVIGVVGQRLVRRLCPHCRREYTPDDARLAVLREMANGSGPDAAPLRLYEPVGCAQCDKMGTKGRVALHEVLVANSQIHRMTMDRAETEAIREAAIANGMIPMVVDGLQKAGQGLTTLEDVQRKVGLPGED